MISPTKTAPHVIEDNLPGERRAFTIKATGKAFRTLIDGLYENKIGAVVRELVSNGYDSHAVAGKSDVPLLITAPTKLDPVFKVRDYGVSMDHETIMDLYSTIFHSTKEASNDEVGMFGLGSKSPFSYTDTFNVTAYLNGEKRVYLAHVADDDVPQITHVGTEEQGDEPQGIEVVIPVKWQDVDEFHKEITRMVLGADVRPIVNGFDPQIDVLFDGGSFRIIEDQYDMGKVAVRQGCVIYPVRSARTTMVQDRYTLIVDVPIGTVDVTASREALSLTPETQDAVDKAVLAADQAIEEHIDYLNASFKNRLEAFRAHTSFSWTTGQVGRPSIKLSPDKVNKLLPGQSIMVMRGVRKQELATVILDPSKLRLIVDDGKPLVRKRMRIAAYYINNYNKTIAVTNPEALPRLVRILGLTKDQVISVHSLPDVQVNRSTGAPAVRSLDKDQWWVPRVGKSKISLKIGNKWAGEHYYEQLSRFVWDYGAALDALGIDRGKILSLTEKQGKKLDPNGDKLLMPELERRAKAYMAKTNLDAKMFSHLAFSIQRKGTDTYRIKTMLVEHYGMPVYGGVTDALARLIEAEVSPADSSQPPTPNATELQIMRLTGADDWLNLTQFDPAANVRSVVEGKYHEFVTQKPSIEELITHYINNC